MLMRCVACFLKYMRLTHCDQYDADITKATGVAETTKDDFLSKLSRVVQLTGKLDVFSFSTD